MSEAQVACSNRNYEKAYDKLNEAIKMCPSSPDAFFERGLLRNQEGLHDLAISDFTEVITQDPGHAKAYFERGRVYCNLARIHSTDGLIIQLLENYIEGTRLDPSLENPKFTRKEADKELGKKRRKSEREKEKLKYDAMSSYDNDSGAHSRNVANAKRHGWFPEE